MTYILTLNMNGRIGYDMGFGETLFIWAVVVVPLTYLVGAILEIFLGD